MAYDNGYYLAYKRYLEEENVRKAHNIVFAIANLDPAFNNVIDLGCGLSEFHQWCAPLFYLGIDLNASNQVDTSFRCATGDYRVLDVLRAKIGSCVPTAFVSLFSAEITASAQDNRTFYEQLFQAFPVLKSGLVSGFYYHKRKDTNPVIETGDVVSYQTLGGIEDYASPLFDQFWVTLPVPSKMFGEDVVEVWRFLKRKQ